jgi:hypothetical protein
MTAATTTADTKAVSTLKAKLAILGHAVFDLAEGGYIVARWGMARHCPDAAALASFLALVEGACK